MAVGRAGFCFWRREYAISMILILTPRKYSCIILASFRLKEDSYISTHVYGSLRAPCIQRSRRRFFVSQDNSTQPRASSVLYSAPASNGRGMLSDSVTVWWLGRVQNNGRSMLEKRLRIIFGDQKGATEWERKGITSRIASKVASPKCVRRACFLAIPMDSRAKKR